jgi:hypothetical protein
MVPITKEFAFQAGLVARTDRECFITNHVKATASDIHNAQLFILRDRKDWGQSVVKWRAVGLPGPTGELVVTGFNAIAGAAIDDLYAVGWGGEIWHHHGTAWKREESPTALALFDVVAVSPSEIYACGKGGTVLRKRSGGAWEPLPLDTKAELRSMAWFADTLFLADGYALYRLAGDKLEVVDFGVDAVVPSAHLHADFGTLLSVAGKEVFRSFDGWSWTRLPI